MKIFEKGPDNSMIFLEEHCLHNKELVRFLWETPKSGECSSTVAATLVNKFFADLYPVPITPEEILNDTTSEPLVLLHEMFYAGLTLLGKNIVPDEEARQLYGIVDMQPGRILGTLGDVNPVEHGGGIVYRNNKNPQEVCVEYTFGLDSINEEGLVPVYDFEIKKALPDFNDRMVKEALDGMGTIYIDGEDVFYSAYIEKLAADPKTSWQDWAFIWTELGQYYGLHNYCSDPQPVDPDELDYRWSDNFRKTYDMVQTWKKETDFRENRPDFHIAKVDETNDWEDDDLKRMGGRVYGVYLYDLNDTFCACEPKPLLDCYLLYSTTEKSPGSEEDREWMQEILDKGDSAQEESKSFSLKFITNIHPERKHSCRNQFPCKDRREYNNRKNYRELVEEVIEYYKGNHVF